MQRTPRELEWLEGFFIKSFHESLESYLYPQTIPFEIETTVDRDPIPFGELSDRAFREIKEGQQWGDNWDSAWFRLKAAVPTEWRGKEVVARLHFGGEACVFDHDGEPMQGLTGASVHLVPFVRDLYRLHPECEGGEEVGLLVEASASQLWGVPKGDIPVAPTGDQFQWAGGPVGVVHYAQLGTFDEEMYQLYFDTMVLYRLMTDLPEDDVLRARIRERMQQARTRFRRDKPDAKAIREFLSPLFELRASGAEPTTISVGHAHLDTAWLWPMRESIRKCVRSFSTQIGLMERYPDYEIGRASCRERV
jgi:alpha-mannosidase